MKGYEAEIKRLLTANGWTKLRQGKGSHEIWGKDNHQPQTVPKGCKSRYLANKILSQCRIDHKF